MPQNGDELALLHGKIEFLNDERTILFVAESDVLKLDRLHIAPKKSMYGASPPPLRSKRTGRILRRNRAFFALR